MSSEYKQIERAVQLLRNAELGQVTQELVAAGVFLARQWRPGKWPQECLHRAFVEGAAWWEYEQSGATMWSEDRDKAETEANRRFGELPADE